MNKLEELFKQYDEFVPPQKFEELVNSAHKVLIQDLEKYHRKLILQIIDSKDSIMNAYANAIPKHSNGKISNAGFM